MSHQQPIDNAAARFVAAVRDQLDEMKWDASGHDALLVAAYSDLLEYLTRRANRPQDAYTLALAIVASVEGVSHRVAEAMARELRLAVLGRSPSTVDCLATTTITAWDVLPNVDPSLN